MLILEIYFYNLFKKQMDKPTADDHNTSDKQPGTVPKKQAFNFNPYDKIVHKCCDVAKNNAHQKARENMAPMAPPKKEWL